MAHVPLILAQLDSDLTYDNSGAGGTGTGTGALRYRTGHDVAVMAALVEEATINVCRYNDFESGDGTGGWAFITTATLSASTDRAYRRLQSLKVVTPGSVADEGAGQSSASSYIQSAGAFDNETWTASAWFHGSGINVKTSLVGRVSGVATEIFDATPVALSGSWARAHATGTFTNDGVDRIGARVRVHGTAATTFYADGIQIEQKDHPTTICPEYEADNTTLRTGYATAELGTNDGWARTAAKIEIPTAEPDWIACRYRETETGAMGFLYTETLTGNNVGTYGKVSHDGSDLVIESDRLLVIGPVYAGTGSLSTDEQDFLEAEDDWTFGMSLFANAAPVVNAGANDSAAQYALWTQAGSFTDASSTSWTATVDYDEGGGPEPLTLAGTTFTLSHTFTTTGVKDVVVVVTDDGDLEGTDTVQVTVSEGLLTGSFVIAGVAGTHPTAPVIDVM